jgi:hypothetical protein
LGLGGRGKDVPQQDQPDSPSSHDCSPSQFFETALLAKLLIIIQQDEATKPKYMAIMNANQS